MQLNRSKLPDFLITGGKGKQGPRSDDGPGTQSDLPFTMGCTNNLNQTFSEGFSMVLPSSSNRGVIGIKLAI